MSPLIDPQSQSQSPTPAPSQSPTLSAWLAQAQDQHADAPQAVAQGLSAGPRGDAARDQLMLTAAHLSQRAWAHAGTWLHQQRAE